MEPRGVAQAEIDAAVRRYLGRMARRYAPIGLGLLVLLLVVTLVPTVGSKTDANVAGGTVPGGTVAAGATSSGQPGTATGGTSVTGPTAAGPSVSTPAGSGSSAAAAAAGGGTPSGGGSAGSATITPPAAAGSAGVARSGVSCGSGVRQVTWSVYAPSCVPGYSGNNGGATFHGVTASTITAVFRRTNSIEEKAAFAAVASAAPGTDDQYLADLRTYIGYFNKTYELYGRKLQVVDYNGVGDNLQEDQGQNIQGAQADAATAYAKGAFLDLSSSPTLASTELYEEALASHKVIAIGAVGLPASWFQQYAPYEWSIAPDGSAGASAVVAGVCQRLAGMPAVFAGNSVYQHQNRVFGLISPDNPQYIILGNQITSGLKACGVAVKQWTRYSINVSTEETQSLSIVGQMSSAGVTSVMCVCDPVMEVFMGQSADNQHYNPEWFTVDWLDPLGRVVSQPQMTHSVSADWREYPPLAQSEALRVYKLANPTGQPQEKYYSEAYWTALYVFGVLQAAGPNLTPQSFAQGAFSMPKSGEGMFGQWQGRPNVYSPATQVQIQYWNANAVSNFDGIKGTWTPCENGKWFNLSDPNALAPAHTQLHCFGK